MKNNKINTNKRLKLIIVDNEGMHEAFYLEENEGDVEHHIKLDLFFNSNKKLAHKTRNMCYYDKIAYLTKNNYILFLDLANYNNYHEGKEKEGLMLLPNKLSSKQENFLIKNYNYC